MGKKEEWFGKEEEEEEEEGCGWLAFIDIS